MNSQFFIKYKSSKQQSLILQHYQYETQRISSRTTTGTQNLSLTDLSRLPKPWSICPGIPSISGSSRAGTIYNVPQVPYFPTPVPDPICAELAYVIPELHTTKKFCTIIYSINIFKKAQPAN